MRNFIQITVSEYNEITQIGNKYIVHILPIINEDNTISCIETITNDYPDIEAITLEYNSFIDQQNQRILNRCKNIKLKELDEFDKSNDVNSFIINGKTAWIDRETRTSINYSTSIIKNSGQETTDLWLDETCYVINCDLLLQLFSQLEMYAKRCYSITAQHRANILNIDNLEELNNYDFTTGYPDKLSFTI